MVGYSDLCSVSCNLGQEMNVSSFPDSLPFFFGHECVSCTSIPSVIYPDQFGTAIQKFLTENAVGAPFLDMFHDVVLGPVSLVPFLD